MLSFVYSLASQNVYFIYFRKLTYFAADFNSSWVKVFQNLHQNNCVSLLKISSGDLAFQNQS